MLGDTATGLSGLSLEEGQNPGLSGSDAWLGQQHQQHLYYQYQQNNGTMNGYGGGSMDSSSGSSGMNDATNHNNDFPGTCKCTLNNRNLISLNHVNHFSCGDSYTVLTHSSHVYFSSWRFSINEAGPPIVSLKITGYIPSA